jgi:SAM-dependent MidA family methyltransferase
MSNARSLIVEHIRAHGPITFAQFMELALYHPEVGYYASAAKRSGGSGDFYTSVDVGPVFGELLAEKFAGLVAPGLGTPARLPRWGPRLKTGGPQHQTGGPQHQARGEAGFDLVEAAAGNGRLSRDVLNGLEAMAPDVYAAARLHLVERSPAAREAQRETLGHHAAKLASSSPDLPDSISGIIFANELLDALPTHAVVGRPDGLREVFIDVAGDELIERELPLSTPAIGAYFDRLGVGLQPGWRAEVNLHAMAWMRRAARALQIGFLVLIDYGHEASVLYSASHAQGTLATFTRHVVETREARTAPWLRDPGATDITSHVDFTSIRQAAEAEGLTTIGIVDQMRFLMGLDLEARLHDTGNARRDLARRLALKTLLIPGGLGTTHHVLIFARAL